LGTIYSSKEGLRRKLSLAERGSSRQGAPEEGGEDFSGILEETLGLSSNRVPRLGLQLLVTKKRKEQIRYADEPTGGEGSGKSRGCFFFHEVKDKKTRRRTKKKKKTPREFSNSENLPQGTLPSTERKKTAGGSETEGVV